MTNRIVHLTEKSLPADCYVYKHSTRCPVSSRAGQVIRAHSFDLPVYWVNVIEQQDISNWIASFLSVQHESPQLIEIRSGKALRILNHGDIRETGL